MPPLSSDDMGPGRIFHENSKIGFQKSKFGRTPIKFLIFAVVFILSAAVSLTYTFMRPAVYESSASLLLSPELSGNGANLEGGAAIQDVAVQSQVLLSRDLLTQVLDKLSEKKENAEVIPVSLSTLKNMVRVTPVENSTIIKMQAEGPEKDVLPIIVNTWLDLYLEKNTQMQTSKSDAASESLQRQILELDNKLTEKQSELNTFRDKYDIVSLQRDENKILAKLKGMNTALNNATEKKITAEANLSATREAIEKGKWAGNYRKPNELIDLEREAEALREEVADYRSRYTDKYLRLDKNTRGAIERLERLEEKILLKYEENRISAIEEAEQEIVSARHAVAGLENKLSASEKKAALFSKRFAEHESLQEELSQLETFSRDLKEELVAMEIKSSTDIIQVKLLERAYPPEHPIRPNYVRDAALSIGLSILLGVLSVLFFNLLTKPAETWSETGARTITYNQLLQNKYPLPHDSSGKRLDHDTIPELEHKMPRELAEIEVQALMRASDNQAQLLISSILNGLSPEEAAGLKWGDIHWESKEIHIPGDTARTIVATELFIRILEQNMPDNPAAGLSILQDKSGNSLTARELESLLTRAANDAGINQPSEITSQVLRHTYISFLVRQGGSLVEIPQRTGPFPSTYQAAYALIRPPGPDIRLAEIELMYPLIMDIDPA